MLVGNDTALTRPRGLECLRSHGEWVDQKQESQTGGSKALVAVWHGSGRSEGCEYGQQ